MFQENNQVSIVLMDIQLPDTNGFVLTEKFKTYKPDVPVIAQTAYAMTNDKINAIETGCDDYISKPIDSKELLTLMNKYLDQS